MERKASRTGCVIWFNDCSINDSDMVEHGKAKSHNSGNIVSYIWAVDAATGLPVSYQVNNGGMVDSKAFQKMITVLNGAGISIEGVILDRGFCTHDVVTAVTQMGYPYILMLKSDTYGHTCIFNEHAEDIRMKVSCVVNGKGLFGIKSHGKLFGNHDEQAYLYLYYDAANGTERSITLIKKVLSAAVEMRAQAVQGKKPAVPKGLGAYLEVGKENGAYVVNFKNEAWQKAVDQKGFHTIACSEDLDPARVNELYRLRDASEKQFMILKSQLGFDVTRVHTTDSLLGKFAVCFVAAILRSEIMTACHSLQLDTNRMIREIDRIALVLMTDGTYSPINNLTERQKQLLNCFSVSAEMLGSFADDVNCRNMSPMNSQMHSMPTVPGAAKKRRGRPPKAHNETSSEPKRKPGRPKGSKNKKTLEREAAGICDKPKHKPGRPKGSKNRKTLEREALAAQSSKPKRGRPKGSKNKPKQ